MKFCITLLFVLILGTLKSQDSQFSQFYANPLYLNPALAGSHSGTYRIMMSYRDQWRGPLENPFTTFSGGGDLKFDVGSSTSLGMKDFAAVGVNFYSDRVSQFDYNTNALSLIAAFHKLLSSQSRQYLSAGIQLGLGQRSINYEDLTFQDQFDGVNQYNFPTAETLPANNIAYPDFVLGLHYSARPGNTGIHLGFAMSHWNQPNISFFNRDNRLVDDYTAHTLDAKYSIHGGVSLDTPSDWTIEPRAIYFRQGENSSVILGSNLKYEFIESDGIVLHIGGWLRSARSVSTYQPSDLILSAGFEKNGLLIGLSYDAFLRDTGTSAIGGSVFELSISFVGEHDNDNEICPEF